MFGKKKCKHGKLQSHIDTGAFICDDCGVSLVDGVWFRVPQIGCIHSKVSMRPVGMDSQCEDCGMIADSGEKLTILRKPAESMAEIVQMNGKKKGEPTRGEYLVGSTQADTNADVTEARKKAAAMIDQMDEIFQNGTDDQARCAVNAMNAFELGCMWAVKAVVKP